MEENSQHRPFRPIRQLAKRLERRPAVAEIDQAAVIRPFGGELDVAPWLDLRHRAFSRERVGVREWTPGDFQAEFTSRWWWRPDWMWLAEIDQNASNAANSPLAEAAGRKTLVGSVVLAMRGEPDKARAVVHWLIVHPRWRRGGIARALMAQLEAAAWDAGHREIFLETHSAWTAAGKFYEALGYRDVRGETQR